MKKVGKREFKNQQARLLRAVARGETLLITDRGMPVAEVRPVRDSSTARSATRVRPGPFKLRPIPNPLRSSVVQRWLEEDREDR